VTQQPQAIRNLIDHISIIVLVYTDCSNRATEADNYAINYPLYAIVTRQPVDATQPTSRCIR